MQTFVQQIDADKEFNIQGIYVIKSHFDHDD